MNHNYVQSACLLTRASYSFFYSRQGSVEYAQLNHDSDHRSDHGNHGDHSVQDVPTEETDTAEHGELKHDPAPDC